MSEDDSGEEPKISEFTRRKMMLATGTAAFSAGLAGCGGDGDGDTPTDADDGDTPTDADDGDTPTDAEGGMDTDTDAPQGEPLRTDFVTANGASWDPETAQLSPFALSSEGPWFIDLVYGARHMNLNLNQEPIAHMAEDWEFSDDMRSVTVTYSGDYEFWDGQEITADDVYLQDEMANLQDFGRRFGDPNKPDDEILSQTDPIRIRYNRGCSESESILLSNTVAEGEQSTIGKRNHADMMDFIERLGDASNQNARDELSAELQDWRWSYDYILEEGFGAGLWKPVDWNSSRIVHEKHGGHPRSDQTNLEEVRMRLIPDSQVVIQEYQSGNLDVSGAGSNVDSQPDGFGIIHQANTNAQLNWRLNQANPHLNKIRVRRALSYAMDFERIVTAMEQGNGTPSNPIEQFDGISPNVRSQTYGNDWADENLIDYGKTAQTDAAESLLQEAGYSRNGNGVWEHPQDGPMELDMISNEWGPHAFVSDFLQSEFQEFGIEFNLSVLSFSGYKDIWLNSHDYDVATWFQQGAAPHRWLGVWNNPEQGSEWMYLNDNIADSWEAPECADMDNLDDVYPPELTSDTYERMDMPIFLEFPAEYGNDDIDLEGETRQLEPFKCQEIFERGSEERILRCAKDFAWAQNFYRPSIGLYNEIFTTWGNSGEFVFPEEGTKLYNSRGGWRFWDEGDITSRTE